MKRLLLLGIFVGLAGCVSTDTHGRDDLIRQIDARFDLSAVRLFLCELVRMHPVVDDVSIEKTQLGQAWLVDESLLPVGLTSGEWTLQQGIGSDSAFELSYRIDAQTAVVFRCERVARGRFQVISWGKEPLVTVSVGRIEM